MALSINNVAPKFVAKSKSKTGLIDVSLETFITKQQIVLLFFPFAFSSVCTEEMCTLSSEYQVYGALNAVVLGVSVDSPFAQEAWAQENDIPFVLISDFNKTISKQYDVLYEDLSGFKGVSKRSAFVIDLSGKISYAWSTEDPHNMPDFKAIQTALNKI